MSEFTKWGEMAGNIDYLRKRERERGKKRKIERKGERGGWGGVGQRER